MRHNHRALLVRTVEWLAEMIADGEENTTRTSKMAKEPKGDRAVSQGQSCRR
jgi:hypothetical protein